MSRIVIDSEDVDPCISFYKSDFKALKIYILTKLGNCMTMYRSGIGKAFLKFFSIALDSAKFLILYFF